MGRKPFTDEEMHLLRQNPYTYRVTKYQLTFTKAFKEIFYSEYQTGELPRQILADHGYDPAILGERRIWGASSHIREQYEKYGGFHEGNSLRKAKSSTTLAPDVSLSEQEELKQLRHEVNYLKQEVEFLKKVSSVKTTRK